MSAMGCKNIWELQLSWTPQKMTDFLPAGEEKHNFSSRAIIIAPSPWLGFLAGEAKKQSKVCLPSSLACGKVSYLHLTFSYPFPGSWAIQREIWKWQLGWFFPGCHPGMATHRPVSVACLEAGCKRLSQLTGSAKPGCSGCPCTLQGSACPPAAPLAFTRPQMCTLAAGQELSGGSQSSAGRSQGNCCPQRQGHQ